MKTVAITGASGFIGRHLVDAYRTSGDFRIRVLSRRAPIWSADGVDHYVGDLSDPGGAGDLDAFLTTADCVIHLAFLGGGRAVNLTAAEHLAASAIRCGVRRIVHCSTAVVIGPGAASLVADDAPPAPHGEYQETKLAIEAALRARASNAIELAILRPTEVIGPGGAGLAAMIRHTRSGAPLANFIRRALLGARRFNYVAVQNVVAALQLLAATDVVQAGTVYNVSDDDDGDNTYGAVEDIVRSALGKPPAALGGIIPISWLSLAFRLFPEHAPPDRIYSHSGLDRLGYRRVTSLRSAVLALVTETR